MIAGPETSFSKVYDVFQSLKTPFYFIIIVAVFTLVHTVTYTIADAKWLAIVTLISIVLLFILALNLVGGKITDKEYLIQLRFARSIGIAGAILCFFIAGEKVLEDDSSFSLVFITCSVQILIFILHTIFKDKGINNQEQEPATVVQDPAKKRINLIQLCLMTTSLLIGITTNSLFSKSEKSRETIASLCLTKNIVNTLNGLSDSVLSNNLNSIDSVTALYSSFKVMYADLENRRTTMNAFLDTSTANELTKLRNRLLSENEPSDTLSHFDSLLSKGIEAYRLGLAMKESMEQQAAVNHTRLSPETDSLIIKLSQSFRDQKSLINELKICYNEVKKMDYPAPDSTPRRYTLINYILTILWGICIIAWLINLFRR